MSDLVDNAREPGRVGRDEREWQSRAATAHLLRAFVVLCPTALAAIVGLFVSRSIPGSVVHAFAIRVMCAAGASVVTFLVADRLGRRFLPLAVLLRLNLVFPDHAPSRFSIALRSTSVRKLQQWVQEARETEDAAFLANKVVTLASALNTHDRRTRGHCERTRALSDLIVEELRLSPTEANEVRWGAFLHDIGKLVVPADILNKPEKPTSREWEILKRHPEAGARLVEPLRVFLSSGVDAVGRHHENFDGSGYPSGLSGEQLPLAARIVSVADAFEVMTAVRAYKRPMTMQSAREELARRSGTQFDPLVVRAFLNVSLGRLHWVLGIAAWMAELPFLTVLPRLAARVSTLAAGGRAAPIGLPGVAAASLGAMAVVGHMDVLKPPPVPPVHAAAVPTSPSPTSALPSDKSSAPAPGSKGDLLSIPTLAANPSPVIPQGAKIEKVGAPIVETLVPPVNHVIATTTGQSTGVGDVVASVGNVAVTGTTLIPAVVATLSIAHDVPSVAKTVDSISQMVNAKDVPVIGELP